MDEARRVLERLERIERLDQREAAPHVLLAELRALVAEAEMWLRAEAPAGRDAAAAVGSLRATLDGRATAGRAATGSGVVRLAS